MQGMPAFKKKDSLTNLSQQHLLAESDAIIMVQLLYSCIYQCLTFSDFSMATSDAVEFDHHHQKSQSSILTGHATRFFQDHHSICCEPHFTNIILSQQFFWEISCWLQWISDFYPQWQQSWLQFLLQAQIIPQLPSPIITHQPSIFSWEHFLLLETLLKAYLKKKCLEAPLLCYRTAQIERNKKLMKNNQFL